MAGFTLGPIASGLPKDIVDRLMESERRPLDMLQMRKKNEEDRLKLVNDLSTRLNNILGEFNKMSRFRSFRELKATNGRPDLVDVTVNNEEAEPGTYFIEIKQLAGRSSMISNGFADPDDTQIGVGYFSYDLPNGDTKEVYIGEDENTLHGIAAKINSDKDLDLQALVVNDGTGTDEPWRLIVSHKFTGEEHDAEYPDFYFTDGDADFYMDEEKPAQNSIVNVNGFDIEFESSKITTLIPGVTLDLKEAAPGKPFQINITEDRAKIEGKIKSMVEKMNEVLSFIQQQNTIDDKTDTTKTLGGDVTIQNIESLMRRMVSTPIETPEGFIRFGDIGVSFQRSGLLEVSEAKLNKALDNNFDGVAHFFTGTGQGDGFIGKVLSQMKSFTQPGGMVTSRQDGIKTRIKDIDRQIETTERTLEQTRKSLQEKFANLDGAIAKMKGQQQYVQSTLGGANSGIPGLG